MPESGIHAGLRQVERRPSGVVSDQVEMLACRVGDAERLLHEPVGFVPVSVWFSVVVVFVTAAARIGSLSGTSPACTEGVPPLALHLPVRQEAAGYAAGAP
jgi:hypothetical protein